VLSDLSFIVLLWEIWFSDACIAIEQVATGSIASEFLQCESMESMEWLANGNAHVSKAPQCTSEFSQPFRSKVKVRYRVFFGRFLEKLA
jgi:hypothetical protein